MKRSALRVGESFQSGVGPAKSVKSINLPLCLSCTLLRPQTSPNLWGWDELAEISSLENGADEKKVLKSVVWSGKPSIGSQVFFLLDEFDLMRLVSGVFQLKVWLIFTLVPDWFMSIKYHFISWNWNINLKKSSKSLHKTSSVTGHPCCKGSIGSQPWGHFLLPSDRLVTVCPFPKDCVILGGWVLEQIGTVLIWVQIWVEYFFKFPEF